MNTFSVSEITGWIAAILVVIIGIPQLIYILRTRAVEKVSMLSWWGFMTAVLSFSFLGLWLDNKQLVYGELAAIIITTATMVCFVNFRKDKIYSNNYKLLTYLALALYLSATIAITATHAYLGSDIKNVTGAPVLANIFSFVAPILATVSFLPQTISGIKNKTLYFLPFGFLTILNAFNIFWIITFALIIASIDNGTHPRVIDGTEAEIVSGIRLALVFSLVFQITSFIIAATQFIFWFIQIKTLKKKIIWI